MESCYQEYATSDYTTSWLEYIWLHLDFKNKLIILNCQ